MKRKPNRGPKKKQITNKNPLPQLACWSQRGDSGGLLANARLPGHNCSALTGIPRAAKRNLRGIFTKKKFPPEIRAECTALGANIGPLMVGESECISICCEASCALST
jgi:hypothetical protein